MVKFKFGENQGVVVEIDIECITCFVKQAEKLIHKFVRNKDERIRIMKKILKNSKKFKAHLVPIELSPSIYHELSKLLKVEDLYEEEKNLTNQKALEIKLFIENLLKESGDPFHTGVKLSIIGNIVDYTLEGISEMNLENFIREFEKKQLFYDDVEIFRQEIEKAETLLYLTDNSGEIVFDLVFLEYLQKLYPNLEITIGAKEKPILNDVTLDDLKKLDINQSFTLVSTGSDLPGNQEKSFKKEFLPVYKNADIVISKGQGNFEGLFESSRPIYFALMAKCPYLASFLKAPEKSMIFKKNQ